jgi:hypothetical protein
MLEVTRISLLTGVKRTLSLNVTPEALAAFENGDVVDGDPFPDCSREDVEFILTGIVPSEVDESFGT